MKSPYKTLAIGIPFIILIWTVVNLQSSQKNPSSPYPDNNGSELRVQDSPNSNSVLEVQNAPDTNIMTRSQLNQLLQKDLATTGGRFFPQIISVWNAQHPDEQMPVPLTRAENPSYTCQNYGSFSNCNPNQ